MFEPQPNHQAVAIIASIILVAAGLLSVATRSVAQPPNQPTTPAAVAQSAPASPDVPRLSLPIDCTPGQDCFIQNYVDLEPSPGVRDHRCGSATYDGHKGVDIRLLSAAAANEGVAVLAAADGIVKKMRDGMDDVFVTAATIERVTRQGCGNSALIDHGGGWQTLYCHMRKGSVVVRPGDSVRRGQQIGNVGYSGLTEFAHVHLMVLQGKTIIDPVSGLHAGEACVAANVADPAATLWDEAAAQAFPYRNGEIIGAGFSARQVDLDELELDHRVAAPQPTSKALLLYSRFVNLRAGDFVRLQVDGPAGFAMKSESKPIERNKATYVAYAGRRRTATRWPSGIYVGSIELIRAGDIIARRTGIRLELP